MYGGGLYSADTAINYPVTYYTNNTYYLTHDYRHMATAHCALNPRTLDEGNFTVVPAKNPRKIAIIGGGIGGMEFALQADKRGHGVDLYEKSDRLGGVFIAAAAPDFKEKDKELLKWYAHELKSSGVTVHMKSEIKGLSSLDTDEIVIATSAKARRLKIAGNEKSITATDYLLRNKEVGDRVAVIGGGLIGCEIAYELALAGKHPFKSIQPFQSLPDQARLFGLFLHLYICLWGSTRCR